MQEMNRKINNVLHIILQTRSTNVIIFVRVSVRIMYEYYIYFNIQDN